MNAWLLDRIGSLDNLRLAADVPEPAPGPGEAVLRIELAALNPADRYLAEGQYPAKPAMPHVLGRDAVGTVVTVGEGVEGVRVGERRLLLRSEVGVSRPGTLAELVAIPVESLVPPPSDWSAEQAAAAPLVYLTAWQALTAWGDLPPAAVVLVTGASGGVGVASVQLAKAMGHVVVAMSRDERKGRTLRDLGADLVVDPNDTQWRRRVRDGFGGRRVDLAIDNVGGPHFSEVLDTLGEHGRVSCVGALAGPVPKFNTPSLFFRRLRVGGIAVGAYTAAESREAWGKVLETLRGAGARPIVDSVWEFGRIREAFERLRAGPMGKVLVRVGQPTG
jgi:NADPH2:quinone reductase